MRIIFLFLWLTCLTVPGLAVGQEGLDLLGNVDVNEGLVTVPEPVSPWLSIGGPVALGLLLIGFVVAIRQLVPFRESEETLLLYYYPTGVKRGLAMAIVMYGIAFLFGAMEIQYQLHLHGSAEAYFANMSKGKLIAFTHAHLFGFTTSFVVIGIPFSMQFSHLKWYQIIFPVGLASALVDVASWWGIKYISPNFEVISIICGILFSVTYLYMLIGLLRVILFPHVVWPSDRDADERAEKIRRARARYEDR